MEELKMVLEQLRVCLGVPAARLASAGADAVLLLLLVGSAFTLIGRTARAVERFKWAVGRPALPPHSAWLLPVVRVVQTLFPALAVVPARIGVRVPPAIAFDRHPSAAADLHRSVGGRFALPSRSSLTLVPPVVSSADVYPAWPPSGRD